MTAWLTASSAKQLSLLLLFSVLQFDKRTVNSHPAAVFIPNLVSALFPDCKLLIIYGNFETVEDTSTPPGNTFEYITSNSKIIAESAGVTNIVLKNNHSSNISMRRPSKTVLETCHVVILLLPVGIPHSSHEKILNTRLNLPLLRPLALKNSDKFITIVENSIGLQSLYESSVIRKIKYSLIIVDENEKGKLFQFCFHCPTQKKTVIQSTNISDLQFTVDYYFPDFQKNYHGSILKVSATDKLPGLIEIVTDPTTGRNTAKRGVHASALWHLTTGLNFTYDLYRSSGGGSTGHPLPNGTWVGAVGDVISGKVDFGLVCGMTYIRHFVIELCSTITYEYISFAIGPSVKLYTWKAIFWPFNALLWVGIIVSTLLATVFSYLLLWFQKRLENNLKWNFISIFQYFLRMFVEQAEDLPKGLSQSLKTLLGFWLLFALIGANVYRAKMVSFMTFPVMEATPETFDELSRSSYDIQFHYFGNVAYNTFKTSTSPTFATIFQKMEKQPDPLQCLRNTVISKSACILFGCVYEELKNRNLSDKFGQSPIKMSPNYGFMYTPGVLHEKGADLSPNFKRILTTSMQMGLNEWWQRSDFNNLLDFKNSWIEHLPPGNKSKLFRFEDTSSNDVLHLKHLKGAFTILIGGLLMAVFSFGVEEMGRIFKSTYKT